MNMVEACKFWNYTQLFLYYVRLFWLQLTEINKM